MEPYIQSVIDRLNSFRNLGEKVLSDGTHLIGKAPHIAPMAWLHSLYPPLTDGQIIEMEAQLGLIIPNEYKIFLKASNGLNAFNTTFCLYGFRKNFNRNLIDVWQPSDIFNPNIKERPRNAMKSIFFIGWYDWDGSQLYIDTTTNKVHLCEREDAISLYQWNSFRNMLESEITRLMTLFDAHGRPLDENKSTLPI